jgi:hypothetical protein
MPKHGLRISGRTGAVWAQTSRLWRVHRGLPSEAATIATECKLLFATHDRPTRPYSHVNAKASAASRTEPLLVSRQATTGNFTPSLNGHPVESLR